MNEQREKSRIAPRQEVGGNGGNGGNGKKDLRIGVVGYGYWGPNIVRNFSGLEHASVSQVCDRSSDALARVRKAYPQVDTTTDIDELITSPATDAVAIVTPVSTHYELAKRALLHGKHIFVEKPFTASAAQAEDLINIAEQKGLTIMVDHTFIFTGAVRRMKEFINDGTLGDLYYYDSIRVNLGLFQSDVNVIWDLAPHDFSIMDYLLPERPCAVSCTGKAHVNGKENIAFVTAHFNNNLVAHFNVNWLSPVKVRLTLLGGEKKMIVWNDAVADDKLRVYDKGIEVKSEEGLHNLLVSYRSGDMWCPKVQQTEALKLEAEYFVKCIMKRETPINDGHAGLRIVRMLEACDESIRQSGRLVRI
jgi:predicted dehydrogenase